MSNKQKTKTNATATSTLPDWLISPYQDAVTKAGGLAAQPAIGSGTAGALNNLRSTVSSNALTLNGGLGSLSAMANGNFGSNALTEAASGNMLAANPFAANGQPTAVSGALGGYAADGQPTAVSGALSRFLDGGALDLSYLDKSGLQRTAAGDFLTPDSNPFIRGVADRSADAAQARINTQFGAAGRSNGSGLYAQLFGQGIADAANDVYASNYENERQRQVAAQGSLLGAESSAREAALAREYGAAGAQFGAENGAAEAAAARRYGASTNIFGAENAASEAAAGRRLSAYDAERQRQQSAAGGLLSSQLTASGQLPSYLSALLNGDLAALQAGQYEDQADLNQLGKYSAILSGLANPFQIQNTNGTSTTKSGGLGSALVGLGGSALAGWASGGFK